MAKSFWRRQEKTLIWPIVCASRVSSRRSRARLPEVADLAEAEVTRADVSGQLGCVVRRHENVQIAADRFLDPIAKIDGL